MNETVYIKATVRRAELIDNATLVFKTLRVGFPDQRVVVLADAVHVRHAATVAGCDVVSDDGTHDAWIASLIEAGEEPFWICDPDVIFHAPVEWREGGRLAGPLEPEHWCPYTQAYHTERLHTCLMRIDPATVRDGLHAWWRNRPGTPWDGAHDLVRQSWTPGRPLRFHDTMSRVYQAIGGAPFGEATLNTFTHLHAGSFSDLLAKQYPELERAHAHFRAHPESGRGLWRAQLAHQATARPKPVLAGDPLLTHQP